jgi:hypothetical protein
VAAATATTQEAQDEGIGREISIAGLSLDDFKSIPSTAARFVHPFEGYPLGALLDVGKAKVSSTFIVALHPSNNVFQDPSGKNVVVPVHDDKGRKTGERTTTIMGYHSRMLPDYEVGGRNTEIVFDRTITFPDGRKLENCAIVPSHSLRAQIMFKIGDAKKGNTEVDKRYVWADQKQVGRLRRVWNAIIKPSLKAERDAQAISGESLETLDEIPA